MYGYSFSQSSQPYSSSQSSQPHGRALQCSHSAQDLIPVTGFSQTSTCVFCICEKIKQFLYLEGSAQEILHNYRIVHSVLTTSQPVCVADFSRDVLAAFIDILDGALLITSHCPEVVNLVSDCLLSLMNMIDGDLRNSLVDKFVYQVRDDPAVCSLEWLQGILTNEDCMSTFLLKYGKRVLPNFCCIISISKDVDVLTRIYTILNTCLTSVPNSFQKQFAQLHIGSGSSFSGETGPVKFLLSSVQKITTDVVRILKEIESEELIGAALEFLTALFQCESAVFTTFLRSNGSHLCTAFRIILNSKSAILVKQGIRVLRTILLSHKTNMQKGRTAVNFMYDTMSSIPLVLLRSDVAYFLMQSMHTLDMDLFNDVIQFFNLFLSTSNFPQERIVPVLEQSLRDVLLTIGNRKLDTDLYLRFLLTALSSLRVVSYVLQEKVLTLFTNILSLSTFTLERKTEYAKVLPYCTDSRLKSTLGNIYEALVGSEDPIRCIAPLKLFLSVVLALLHCEIDVIRCSQDMVECEAEERKYLSELMSERYLTALFGLLHTVNPEEDKSYIIAILRLVTHFGPEDIKMQKSGLPERIETLKTDSGSDATFEVLVPHGHSCDGSESSSWTGETMLDLAFLIRNNLELMRQVEIYHKWNLFMARVLQHVSQEKLPQVTLMWRPKGYAIRHAEAEAGWSYYAYFWTRGLSELPLDITNWVDVLDQNMFNSRDPGGERIKYTQDTVLLSFYSYYLYAPNARTDFLSQTFFINLTEFLRTVILNRRSLLPPWDHLCFYLNIGILLCSRAWADPAVHPVSRDKIVEVMLSIEIFLKESPVEDITSLRKMITFRWDVILLVSEFQLFPGHIFNKIVEFWLENYFEDFERFLETYRPGIGTSNEAGLALVHALTSILTSARSRISSKILFLWRDQRAKESSNSSVFLKFGDADVYNTLLRLVADLRLDTDLSAMTPASTGAIQNNDGTDLSHQVGNLALFLDIVLDTPYNGEPFSPDFYINLMRVIRRHATSFQVGERGLRLIIYWLPVECLGPSLRTSILSDSAFLKFLEKCISFESDTPSLCFLAFEVMTSLVGAVQSGQVCLAGDRKVEWSLYALLENMPHAVSDMAGLRFFKALLEVDLQSPFVKVLEASGDEDWNENFDEIFFSIGFELENLAFKLSDREEGDTVWETMTEMLNFSMRQCLGECDPSHTPIGNFKVLKDTVAHSSLFLLIQTFMERSPDVLTAPPEFVSFLEAWKGIISEMTKPDTPESFKIETYKGPPDSEPIGITLVIDEVTAWLDGEQKSESPVKERSPTPPPPPSVPTRLVSGGPGPSSDYNRRAQNIIHSRNR